MNIPESKIYQFAEDMARKGASFAFCRKPWTDEPILVLQTNGQPAAYDSLQALDGIGPAYLITPFCITPQCPAVGIRPDKIAHGWEEIATLAEYMAFAPMPAETTAPAASPQATGMEEALRHYTAAFACCKEALRQGMFNQIALACKAGIPAPEGFTPLGAFIKACNSYPRMMVYLVHTPTTGTWLGCSPEAILAGHGKEWATTALDGTLPFNEATPRPQWPPQSCRKQSNVAAAVKASLKGFGLKPEEKEPVTARAGHLLHLKTDFTFHLKNTAHIGTLLDALHPAPSVSGTPAKEAAEFVTAQEGFPRGYYAGIIGWLDPECMTKLYVNLRCMHMEGNTLSLYAGGSVLPSSTLEEGQEDIRLKMKTMTHIIDN